MWLLRIISILVTLSLAYCIVLIIHPKTPLPDEWNPRAPLRIDAPVTGLTAWKLRHALNSDSQCESVLAAGRVDTVSQPPLIGSEACHIRPRVTLSRVGAARLAPVETRCQTALRLAMWERHGLQVAARRHLGSEVREIRHFSSYNCRRIRTSSGESRRMSSHATADALDVSGFVLKDGRSIDLRRDWVSDAARADFLRDAFQAACLWFPVALGPEFNALHADHFHLQGVGWGLCR